MRTVFAPLFLALIVSFVLTITTPSSTQAAPAQNPRPEFFTDYQVQVLCKLLDCIEKAPHGYVRVTSYGEAGYRISFEQASSEYLLMPTFELAVRLEGPRKLGKLQPTRLYGRADYDNMIHQIASEANEPIPTLTPEEMRVPLE
jgi:hypothetical protein